ncbi:hypothetical protein OROGR_024535 [Orobanche gracilis]
MARVMGCSCRQPDYAIEVILMDDKGSRIQATVRKYLAHKHEKLLREGSVYDIRNFTFADNSGTFKVANHEFKITWQSETTALLQSDALVPSTMYSFVDFAEVVAGVLDDTILVDVIGLMTRLNAFLAAGDLSNVVVVIMCGKIKEFQGKRTIQNGLYCCKLMFNPTFPAALEFKEKMLQRQNSPSQGLGRIVDTSQSTLEDDFLYFNERKTLAELKENGIYAECCYIVEATIKYLVDPQAWWYNVYTCNKAVQADGLSYYCGPCVVVWLTRNLVIDETDSTNFVIFDRHAAMLLNRSCFEVIESCEKTPAGVTCPVEIMNLLDRKFLFKVAATKDSPGRFEPSYTLKRVTDDADILEKFRASAPAKEIDTADRCAPFSKCSMGSKNISSVQPMDLMSQFSENENNSESSNTIAKDIVSNIGTPGVDVDVSNEVPSTAVKEIIVSGPQDCDDCVVAMSQYPLTRDNLMNTKWMPVAAATLKSLSSSKKSSKRRMSDGFHFSFVEL